jgi:hypothetical protein
MWGRAVTLGFSLGDPRDGTMARMKERHRAGISGCSSFWTTRIRWKK